MHENNTNHDAAYDAVHDAAVCAAFDARVFGTPDDATGPLSGAAAYVARHAGLPMDHAYVIDAMTTAGFDVPM